MKEHENSLNPEAIDKLTERSSSQLPQEVRRLVQGFYTLSQEYARENERSLERIWNRFVQSQEHAILPQKRRLEKPEGKLLFMEGKAMQEKDFQWGTENATLRSQPAKQPRRFGRTLGISVAAAVVLLTILSWAFLSAGLLHRSQAPVTHGSSTNAGAPQKAISHGTLLCSFSDNNNTLQFPVQPSLDWSSQDQIATTYDNLKIFNAQSCAHGSSLQTPSESATWSPDGKRLIVSGPIGTPDAEKATIIDASTGNVIARFPAAQQTSMRPRNGGAAPLGAFSGGGGPATGVSQSIWTADGTQVVSIVTTNAQVTVQLWDASTGASVRTLLTLPLKAGDANPLPSSLSPNGKYLAVQLANNSVEIWNVDSGARVSTIPFQQELPSNQGSPSAVAWSPDGASLALGLTNASKVQIWSTATGRLTTSFTDHDAAAHVIGALAWSSDGKYIAESGSDVHIWNVTSQKFVATFGRIDGTQWIATLAWAPNSRMLVSSTNGVMNKGKITENKVNVWKLA